MTNEKMKQAQVEHVEHVEHVEEDEELMYLRQMHEQVMGTKRMLEAWVRVMDAQAIARRNASVCGRAIKKIKRCLGLHTTTTN